MIKNQKILFLTAGHVNYDCYINFYKTLVQMFSTVLSYDYVEQAKTIGIPATNIEIIEIVKKEKPAYAFLVTHLNQIDLKTLDTLDSLGTKVVAWFSDDNWRFENYSKIFAKHIFCSISTYKCAVEKYKELGLRVIKSQWASTPDYYKKTACQFLYDVSFVGGKYGKRQENIEYLIKAGIPINIFGKGFNDFLAFDKMIKVFNESRINLNFSDSPHEGFGLQIKGRVFEIAMCGGFLLTEYTEGIEEYFEIGKEIVCFTSLDEAVEKIKYYLTHEDARRKIAEAGHIRALKDHTWRERLETIFNQIEQQINKEQIVSIIPSRPRYEEAFHGDNYLLAFCDSILYKSEVFVETGTYYGHTSEYVARTFKHLQVYSCEPKPEHFIEATKKLAPFTKQVTLFQDTSLSFLQGLIQKNPTIVDKEVVFWLDAHSFGYNWPLLDEIKFITKTFIKAHIFIDDFKIPGKPVFQHDKTDDYECAWETIYEHLYTGKKYTIHFPDYIEKTSTHHPLVGWILIEFGHNKIQIPTSIKKNIKSIDYPYLEEVQVNARKEKNSSMNILLTTSAAPSQTPFSTTEKRPPIGIGFLISVLKNAGHNVFFIDNYLQPSDFLETGYLRQNDIDYVGIYANTICFRDTLRMLYKLEWFRQTNRWNGKIVVGGPHTTVCPDTIPDFVDFVVKGEGEQAILDIVEEKIKNRIVETPRIENLDKLSPPAWDYFVNLPYDWGGTFFTEKPIFVVNSSRGCPFRCSYCSVGSIWGKKYTAFSAERIVSDIEYLINHYGAKGIYFREDNFTLNKNRLNKFCNLMIEKKFNIPWACESRVSSINRQNIKLMKEAGVCGFYFGVESGSQRVLDFVKKDITLAQTRETFKLCHEYGIKSAASIIVGVPTETEEELNQTLALVAEIKPTVTWFNVFTGIPNSELYKYTIKNNLYEFIDDRGLVYLKGHNKFTKRFYHGNWDAEIPTITPQISVVMSVHNGEQYLKEAVQSILRQSYQDFEFIIIDDGSTDKTSEIIKSFNDFRIKVITNSENLGLTKSLNKGAKTAKGKYIARMDADDISLPHRFEVQTAFLEKNPQYALVGSSYYQINSTGKIVAYTGVLTKNLEIRSGLLKQNWFGHGSVMIRKSAFIDCNGYDEEFEYAQDYDLWLRLSEQFKIANIEEPLYEWRSTPTGISTLKKDKQVYYANLAVSLAKIRNIVVSVIVPTYNRPEMLREALKSVFAQTHRNFEIIVINDAGIDVKDIIAGFNINNIIIYLQHIENKGLAAARNSGLKIAKGKYITYLDDDDVFYPDHIETLVTFLENSEYKIAYTDAVRVDQILKKSGGYGNIVNGVYMSRDFSREALLKNNIAPIHCFMHEKSCLEGNIIFDEKLSSHEDWDLWIKLSKKYDFKHIKKNTVEYRHRTEGFTQLSNPVNLEFSKTGKIVQDKYREERILPLQSVKTPKAMENMVVLKTRKIYKWLFEGKKYTFEKGKPVVMPLSYVAILKQKRDDNGKSLFE